MRSKLKFLLPFVFAACGNAAGPDYAKTLVTFNGTITSSVAAPTAPVRVALVWELANPEPGTGSLKSAQELGVHTQFPVDFKLDVNTLPPEEAMTSIGELGDKDDGVDPNLRFGYGTIIVYADTNGDGKLDLLPLNAQSSTDQVLGVAQDIVVFYIEGTPPPASDFMGIQLSAGFNLLQQSSSADGGLGSMFTLLSLSTEIPIALTAAPSLAQYLCEQDTGSSGSSGGSASASGFTPPPAGAQVSCSADGLSFTYTLCAAPASLCSGSSCDERGGSIPSGTTAPAGWPCN